MSTGIVSIGKERGRSSLKVVALGLIALTLTSCSKAFDAIVFNPCDRDATVSFGLASAVKWYSETTVPAESAVRVDNVMDASSGAVDHVRVVFGEAPQSILKVRVGEDDPVPVLIPVAVCPSGNRSSDAPLTVQYTVDLLPLGTEGHARVMYREPDGTMTTERVILPWRSDILVFPTGDLLMLEAKTLDRLDQGEIASLQCEVLIDVGNPEGKAAGSSRANMCDVKTLARTSGGFSFPD